jgi:putative hydrolase of the HAD superfamily
MIYWIFDMDETLYNSNGNFSYDKLHKDTELIALINKLNGRKILFTNGAHQHANIVLNKMGLVSSFDLILDRNILGILKPHPLAYIKLIKWCSITKNDTCYFFEDTINNLIIGNSFGWQSILINKNVQNSQNRLIEFTVTDKSDNKQIQIKKQAIINYTFKNIKTALRHFLTRLG